MAHCCRSYSQGNCELILTDCSSMTPASPAPRARTILVVDDEPVVRTVVRRLLEQLEFDVVEAGDGEDGLRVARRVQGSLTLVISDLTMPVMDGMEFLDRFRPLYPDVPVLFITGQGTRVLSRMSGKGEHLLLKPFEPDLLLEAVARLLALVSLAPTPLPGPADRSGFPSLG
jgi:CheY-like chemotaxis protein